MKYLEMLRLLKDNGIIPIQTVIANEVDAQLETDIFADEFERICANVYKTYLDCPEEPDIFDLVSAELFERGLK